MNRSAKTLRTTHRGLKEGPKLFRIFGLLACCGMAATSIWLANESQAQSPAPYRRAQSSSLFDDPLPASNFAPAASSEVDSARVIDYVRQAERALSEGDRDQAVRIALAADRHAREMGVTFAPEDPSPEALLVRLQGVNGPSARATPSAVNAMTQGNPGDHEIAVQRMLREADAKIRSGEYEEALAGAKQAESYCRQHQVEPGVFDLKPSHIISEIRRLRPELVDVTGANQRSPRAAAETSLDPQQARQQSDVLVQSARQQYTQGNYDEARRLALEAKRYNVEYSLFEETPDHVLQDVSRATQSTVIEPRRPTETTANNQLSPQKERAVELVKQARAAMQQGDLASAQQFASDADQLGAMFAIFEDRPEIVLQEIRQTQTSLALNAGPSRTSSGIQQTGGTDVRVSPEKQHAEDLIRAARQAMRNGQYDVAEQNALQAQQYRVAYDTFEDTPDLVLEQLARLTQTRAGDLPVAATNNDAQIARQLLQTARQSMNSGDLDTARRLALQADQMSVAYDQSEDRPDRLLADVERLATANTRLNPIRGGEAGGVLPVGRVETPVVAEAAQPARDAFVAPAGASALDLFNIGMKSLRSNDPVGARQAFLAAYQSGETLDPVRQQQMQDYLRELTPASGIRQVSNTQALGNSDPLNATIQRVELRDDHLRSITMDSIYRAERIRDRQPEEAIAIVDEAINKVEGSNASDREKSSLLASLRSERGAIEAYFSQKKPLIEMERKNTEVREQVRRRQQAAMRIEQELADLVEQFNEMNERHEYAQAFEIAKAAREIAPDNAATVLMYEKSKLQMRIASNTRLREDKEDSFWNQLNDVENAAINKTSDRYPMVYGDNWEDIKNRAAQPTDMVLRSEEELMVRAALEKPVSLHFQDEPLSNVMAQIASQYMINVHVDDQGLLESGVTSSTPVSINVDGIKLKNALSLIFIQATVLLYFST